VGWLDQVLQVLSSWMRLPGFEERKVSLYMCFVEQAVPTLKVRNPVSKKKKKKNRKKNLKTYDELQQGEL
jgi:hypothetical protein